MNLRVRVHGRPAGQGSKNKGRYGSSYEASTYLKPWREAVIAATKEALSRTPGFDTSAMGVDAVVTVFIKRPKSHYGTGRNADRLKPGAPYYCASPPDLDKYVRAVLDSMTQSGAIVDDRRVVRLEAEKVYDPEPGALITLSPRWFN